MATTWNPSDKVNTTLSNGNLTEHAASASSCGVRSIYSATAGKYYFEISFAGSGIITGTAFGIANSTANLSTTITTGTSAAICNGAGAIAVNGSAQTGVGAFSNGNVCCIAMDMNGKLVWFRRGAAGNWNGSGSANPATGVGGYSFSGLTGGSGALFAWAGQTGATATDGIANFGDSAFTGAVPSGFTPGLGTVTAGPRVSLIV